MPLTFLSSVDADGFAPRQEVFDAVKSYFDLPDSTESIIKYYRSSYFQNTFNRTET